MQPKEAKLLTATDFVKESELIKNAAHYAGLEFPEGQKQRHGSIEFESKNVGIFDLDKSFLSALENAGFSFEPGTKPPHDTMIYLSGNSNQHGQETFYSDCWAWKRTEKSHQLTINFKLSVSESKRGVICVPRVWGNCSGGACHLPTIHKFVSIVADHFPETHSLIKQSVYENFEAVINWSDIGVGGIKSIETLFYEERNQESINLANSNFSPFEPKVRSIRYGLKPEDRLFVVEPLQSRLLEQWKKQLEDFKKTLK